MQTLLKKLNKFNIKIDLVNEKLDIQAPKGVMTEDLLNEIKLHKNDLIAFITLYKTKKEEYLFIPQVPEQSSYVLSSSQRRLWLLSQFEGGNAAYNMPSVFELKGNVAISFLEKSFFTLIERHESLRTVFKEDETGDVRQVILNLEDIKFQLHYEDLRNKENLLEITKAIIQKETTYSFDLSSDSLLRAKLVKTSQDTYIFICVMHHIISDGQSAEVMTNELFALYDGYVKGNQNSLTALQLQYKDYAAWQQGQLINDDIESHKSYWLQQFEGELPVLELPTYQARPAIKTYNGKSANAVYNQNLFNDFNDLCQSQGSTLFIGLLATVKVLLYRYTNQNDIVIGSPIAGREHADLQNQIGIYVNTLALRTQFDGEDNFSEVLANVKKVTFDAYEHQVYPFDELVEQLPLHRDRSRNPLFDVMVTLQNADNLKANIQSLGAITIEEYNIEESTISKFDLGFTFGESDKGLELTLTYNTDIYSEEFVERILNHLETLLRSIVMKPNVSISSLNYITEIEKHQLLIELNTSKVDYPKDKTIVDLFEAQVDETPENTAVIFDDVKLTYGELNAKANQLAHYLKEQGVETGSSIVLCFDSHLEMAIIGIIGILKVGAVYVPIDPDYPKDRINYIIENSGAKFIVTNSIDAPLLQNSTLRTILLDKENSHFNPDTIKNIRKQSTDLDSAYVIYTSGTTGTPKGVLVNHQNIMDYLFGLSTKIKIEENQSFALMSTVSTDLGNTVLFSSLIFGGVIHLFSKNRLRDIYYIQQYFTNNEIDCIKIVPSYWKSLEINGKLLSPSRMIVFGGEELSNEIVSRINLENPNLRVINHYGPTETTIGKLLHEVNPSYSYNRIPIGKAFSNTQLYVVDRNLSLCAIGIIGELLVGGDGVSNGYLNNLKLSEEKFIDNVFRNDGSKLYRTGDLVLMHSDGNIEYKGRIDNQVKILGHRIELNEIENALNKFEDIKSNVVNVIETDKGNKRIVAYIVCKKQELAHNEILDDLRLLLPSIMIPSILIKIDEIPFTSNGKINYKALPSISEEDVLRREYVSATNDIQIKLVEIWQEVLGVQKIGVTDNFFELGGHSLIVAQVINRTYKVLGKSISFRDFFANPTVEGLSKKFKETYYSPILKAAESISYPLTSAQNRLWILSQLEGGSVAYNMPVVLRITGDINYHLFQNSFNKLIQRHEILRTYFKINEQDVIRQYVVPFETINFSIDQVDFINKSNTEKELENYLQSLNDEAFDLEQFPLIRASLINITDKERIFFFSRHHIIGDGWSSQIIISEVVKTYNALVQGKEINLPELNIQYKDYALWFNEELQQDKHQASEQYWFQQFSGELPVLDLPSFKIRPLIQTYNGDSITHNFPREFLENLKTFSKEQDVTLFMSLMAGINSLLYRYTSQRDIIIGTPIAGREHPDLENQLGLYLNTLAIRTQFKEKGSFLDLLALQKETLLDAYEHQSYPFDELVGKLNLKRDTSRSALFDVMVVLQNQGQLNNVNNEGQLNGLQVEEYDFRRKTSQFDISFTFAETEGLELTIEYNTDIYDDYLIRRMVSHFEKLITESIKQPKINIQELDYLTESEKHQLFVDFNDTEVVYPADKTIIDLFEEQVAKTPNNLAVVFDGVKLTYKNLNEKSNQLAYYLRKNYSIKPDDLVGIKLDRSEMMIIAILGILKSGAAYVPIDINYPPERIAYIENDSNSKIVVDEALLESFNELPEQYSKVDIEKINLPNDLAYVIYTSGTTGNPKGVMVEHKNIINLIAAQTIKFDIKETENISQFSNIAFDASVEQIFLALLNGACLSILNKDTILDNKKIEAFIDINNITHFHTVPSILEKITPKKYPFLKRIISGGDICSVELANKWSKYCSFYNEYGPTETTVTAIELLYDKNKDFSIGAPISNTQVYILDETLEPVAIGVTGKIYLSGAGVARGYLNNHELTLEKFVANPFKEGERMYDTGDLGCWLTDGKIKFLGRKDQQVKIRGYRIELGEIENTIFQYSDILKQVVVEVKENNQEKILVAYLVSTTNIDKSKLRSFLQDRLPDYMVPGFYLSLEELPLTPNGKIDRKALPNITGDDILRKEYVAPRNKTEKSLVTIWQEVLGIEKIGIKDNFFELGGHSLIIVQVINRIHKQLGKTVSFKSFFANPIIEGLSKQLQENEYIAIPKTLETESYPLTSSQTRLWILSQLEGGSLAYNMSAAIKLTGTIDVNKFKESFRLLIDRHEILRTYFKINEKGDVRQYIVATEQVNFEIIEKDFSSVENQEEAIADYLQEKNNEHFDLEKASLIRSCLIRLKESEYVFFLTLHHIIGDGWSIEILISEIIKTYNALTQGNEINLPDLSIQYKDYAVWLSEELQQERHQVSEQYWLQKFEGELPVLDLPSFKARPLVQTYSGDSLTYTYSKDFLNILKSFSKESDVTLFMTLMAGINTLLHRYTGQDDIIIGTPIAGREHPDLENHIGLFLNTLALRTHFEGKNSFNDIVQKEKHSLLEAYEHQNYPFDTLVSKLDLKRDTSRSALFDVLIVLQSQDQLNNINNEKLINLEVSDYDFQKKTSKFDIIFTFVEREGLNLTIEYNTEIYDLYLIERMFAHFEKLLMQLVAQPEIIIEEVDYLTADEKQQLLIKFNDTKIDYPQNTTVIDLFEQQVEKSPNSIAVVFENKELTYNDLNEQANQLGSYLREKYAIQSDDLIGIELDRSERMIVAILGILKSGGAYVPIDPSYPQERIKYIKNDSNVKVVIDEEELEYFYNYKEKYLRNNLKNISSPENLVYVIYTSGTTGNPKGVMMQNDNIINLLLFHINSIKGNSKTIQLANNSFDVSFQEIFTTLLSGATLYPISDEIKKDILKLTEYIINYNINTIFLPTAYFKVLIENNLFLQSLSINMKNIIVAGEQLILNKEIIKSINQHSFEIHNHYGPAETHVVTTYVINKNCLNNLIPPIGRPITNTHIYILDADLNPLPIGVAGKIYISGAAVSRGYLNKPELTAEKFIDNPFMVGTRMYDTGDLGRWLPDGNIDFFGRKDHQEKIRGFRIELGEIEATLLQYSEDLKQVVVEAREVNGEKTLVAYYVSHKEIDKSQLRDFLHDKLPDYMVPSIYVTLEKLLLTSNGKIDRKALPSFSTDDVVRKEYVAPRNEIEKQLVLIWQEVLGIDKIGISDNFFELGGSSIGLIKLLHKVNFVFDKQLTYNDLMVKPTINNLQSLLISIKTDDISFYSFNDEGISLQQEAMLKNCLLSEEISISLNLPFIIEFENYFYAEQLKNKVVQTLEKDSNFNYTFSSYGKSYVKKKCKEPIIPMSYEINNSIDDEIKKIVKHPFNLLNERLVKLYILKNTKSFFLVGVIHHLIFDFKSIDVLFNRVLLQIEKPKFEYQNYIKDQQKIIQSNLGIECLKYFSNKTNIDYNNFLKYSDNTKRDIVTISENKRFLIDAAFSKKIIEFCKENKISNNLFFILVIHLTNKLKYNCSSSLFKVVEHGRFKHEHDQILGICRNYLPLCISTQDTKLEQIIENITSEFSKTISFQGIPYYELVEKNEGLNQYTSIYYNNLYDINTDSNLLSESEFLFHDPLKYNMPKLSEKLGLIVAKGKDGVSMQISLYYSPNISKEILLLYFENLKEVLNELINK